MYFYNIAFLLKINFSGPIKAWLRFVYALWNGLINETYRILLLLPTSKTDDIDLSDVNSALNSINSIFVGVATSLLILFFLLGFCSETTNVREEMRFDTIVRYLIRLVVAEYFVIHSKEILMNILKVCKAFCKELKKYLEIKNAKLSISADEKKAIEALGFVESILVLIVVVIIGAIILFLGISVVWTVYTRFLKVCLMIPFGALAFATMAGPSAGEVSRISSSYAKAFLANAISSIVIAVALIFGIKLMMCVPIKLALPEWVSESFTSIIGIMLGKMLQASVMVACVKEAEYLTERMMGAY